ncbi:MAG: FAD-dependent oxidoreductase [Clostridiaceae bacterium]|nr:FAD-dependent oxidoreductase [Clostridiaceae bacterium]
MDIYHEPARDIPQQQASDVLVLGAGPAGVAAAVWAARSGARTRLIERSGDVGGMATIGLMSHWTGSTRGGFYQELLERSHPEGSRTNLIDPERLKTVLLDLLQEADVDLQLYTLACRPIMENRRIAGVVAESKSGREALPARVVVDATGDGDIAAQAGVPYVKGREQDGKMQPMTLMFKIGGVDTARAVFPGSFEETAQVPAGEIQALARAHLPYPAGHVLLYPSTLPGIVTCNMTNCIDVDGTKAGDLTRAQAACRRQLDVILDFLKTYVPGFEKSYIVSSASLIGVRETRHFKGDYTLTEDDILQARVFDDWAVTQAHFNFDVHNLTGPGLDATGVQRGFAQKNGYTIPYRCFLPQGVDGLLLAGRNISGTHLAHANYRVMPICANMGQAAGIAAALSVRRAVNPRDLEVRELQQALLAADVRP